MEESGTEDEENVICQCNPCKCDAPDGKCLCDPCYCDTPEDQSPRESNASLRAEEPLPYVEISNLGRGFTLDEFVRAKEYFMVTSTNSGLSVYDHLSEVIRKLLDERNPPNVVDFMEEISYGIKRYRFGLIKQIVREAHYISPAIMSDSYLMVNSWKKHALWSGAEEGDGGEDKPSLGGFTNMMRLLYYLEQVNVGLPKEEMFRLALAIRDLSMNPTISRARFWGKIFGICKNYYILEVEFKVDGPDDVWEPPPSTPPEMAEVIAAMYVPDDPAANFPGAGVTFQRAGYAVMDPEILSPYQETSGLPPDATSIVPKPRTDDGEFYGEGLMVEYDDPNAAAEIARWEQYQNELMTGFPIPPPQEVIEIPKEEKPTGLNRRAFYVCNELGDDWVRLPDVTPQQINTSRVVRWQLSGNLFNKLKTFPDFPGREGNYLRALLARITAGSQVSPRGYFKTNKYGGEYGGEDDDDEDVDEEEEEGTEGNDTVYPVKKFRPPPMTDLLNPVMDAWVHHASHILRQGRVTWWNPTKPKKEVDEEDDEEVVEEEEEEEDEENPPGREVGPSLFSSLSNDKTLDGTAPWSPRPSSTVFTEFQVASARSNIWPGATSICTVKGKVENIYFGDGLKFFGKTYSPDVPDECQSEYIPGPELLEINDPTVEEEQAWLAKLQSKEVADVEEEFVDNEEVEEEVEVEETDED